jgi:hypothetical protein
MLGQVAMTITIFTDPTGLATVVTMIFCLSELRYPLFPSIYN